MAPQRKKQCFVLSPDSSERTLRTIGYKIFAALKSDFEVTVLFPSMMENGSQITQVIVDDPQVNRQ